MSGDSGAGLVSVTNSALFDSANSESLTYTEQAGTSTTKQYISVWVQHTSLGTADWIWGCDGGDSVNRDILYFNSADSLTLDSIKASSQQCQLITTQKFRDVGFYHIEVLLDTTLATAADRNIIKVNGVRITDFSTETNFTQNDDFGSLGVASETFYVGRYNAGSYFDGYMSEFIRIDGNPSGISTGEFDTTGNYWTPKSSTAIKALTFGTNGFYLDNTTNAQTDASGEGNNFTNNNTVVTSTHTPTNLFGFLNPLNSNIGTLSNGNRTYLNSGTAVRCMSTISFPAAGKFYFEGTLSSFSNGIAFGIAEAGGDGSATFLGGNYAGISVQSGPAGRYYRFSATRNDIPTSGTNALTEVADTLMLAVDCAEGKIWIGFYDDSLDATRWIDASDGYQTGDQPGAGTNATIDLGNTLEGYQLAVNSTSSIALTVNFGEVAYTRTAPAGFKSFNTTNIAEATTRTQSDPYEHWNNILYTGNGTAIGSGGNAITGAGFAPDFGWIKGRSGATEHVLTDIVRGVTKEINSDSTNAESTVAEGLTAFGSDGFTVGSDGSYNTNSATYVAWLAKLGGTASTNEDGTIDSSVSVNQTLGMSVGTYTGSGAAATIGHGLGVTPEFIIVRDRDTVENWLCYHSGTAADAETDYLILNTTAAAADLNTVWNDTAPTSSVFTVGTANCVTSRTYMFIAFAPSEYISIGSYSNS